MAANTEDGASARRLTAARGLMWQAGDELARVTKEFKGAEEALRVAYEPLRLRRDNEQMTRIMADECARHWAATRTTSCHCPVCMWIMTRYLCGIPPESEEAGGDDSSRPEWQGQVIDDLPREALLSVVQFCLGYHRPATGYLRAAEAESQRLRKELAKATNGPLARIDRWLYRLLRRRDPLPPWVPPPTDLDEEMRALMAIPDRWAVLCCVCGGDVASGPAIPRQPGWAIKHYCCRCGSTVETRTPEKESAAWQGSAASENLP